MVLEDVEEPATGRPNKFQRTRHRLSAWEDHRVVIPRVLWWSGSPFLSAGEAEEEAHKHDPEVHGPPSAEDTSDRQKYVPTMSVNKRIAHVTAKRPNSSKPSHPATQNSSTMIARGIRSSATEIILAGSNPIGFLKPTPRPAAKIFLKITTNMFWSTE